ncbi:MAG TPA: PAS domain-containing protein [Rhizomicrobium sp.]|jgi:hypothetical protein
MTYNADMQPGAASEACQQFNDAAKAAGWAALCDANLAFGDPRFDPLVTIWHEAAAQGRLPRRPELGPRTLKLLLKNIAIYERAVAGGTVRYRVRLMGTAFADVMGDLSGKFLDEAVPPQHLPRWHAALDAAIAAGAPLRFMSRSDTTAKSYLVAEYFEAPLVAEDGSVSLILAAGYFAPRSWREVAAHEQRRDRPAALTVSA